MIIKLISTTMKNDIFWNFNNLKEYIKNEKEADILVFGEAYLQGFNSLTWNYEKDKYIAISIYDREIVEIREICNKYKVGVSFGFYEIFEGYIYSSNIVIDKNGEILNIYRRVSKTWKLTGDNRYKEGDDFHTFTFMNKKILPIICGDLWFNKYIKRINSIDKDFIFWPLYIDYSISEWESSGLRDYIDQSSKINVPILMVNSYSIDEYGAIGGAYEFYKGEIKNKIDLGSLGELKIELI